jgi:hypothetical protein
MAPPSVRDQVTWSVQDPPLEARLVRGLTTAAFFLATVGEDLPWWLHRTRRPRRVWALTPAGQEWVDLEPLLLSGDAAWMPAWSTGTVPVAATGQNAWMLPADLDQPAAPMPLHMLRVVGARPLTRWRRPKRPRAAWVLTLSDAVTEVDLQGSWLSLAWVAHLAGWPEPALTQRH